MIHVGTCSWAEKTLVRSGEFYPKKSMSAEDRLKFYASNFDTVEVDSSYYAIPDKATTELWAYRAPEGFTFHIKAYGALTGHGVNPKTLPKDIAINLPDKELKKKHLYIKEPSLLRDIAEHHVDSLVPLAKAGKLGIIVFQYPQWFHYRPESLDYILACKRMMKDLPIAVEFRHGSWLTPDRADSVFDFLREHSIAYVTADEPQYGSLATVPFVPQVTADIAYFRLHGRNRDNWLKKGIETSQRYDYHYSDNELKGFIPSVVKANKQAKKTYVMFNNCHGGFAVRNALRMEEMLKGGEGA
jgi:uncharacterized protein YecE (DUF72 family)